MSLRERDCADNHFVTWTDWQGYLKFLDAVGEGHVKVTYDRGKLELLSPSRRHEKTKTIIGALLECLMEELGVAGQGGGSTTFRRMALDRGLEPDECYWIRSMLAALEEDPDPERVPRPDLAVEVEISRSSIDRLAIYAALGVPEVWRWVAEGEGRLRVLLLTQPGVYETANASATFPTLPLDVFEQYVHLGLSRGQIPTVRQFRAWVKETLGGS